jgi:phage terminase small subunit
MKRRPRRSQPADRKLTERQRRFIELYIGECAGNGKAAAICAGYSVKAAKEIAYELLQNDIVRDALEVQRARAASRLGLSADDFKRKLEAIATATITDFVRVDRRGHFVPIRPFHDLPWYSRAAIAQIKATQFGLQIKLHDKIGAIALLAKLQGWVIEKHEVKHEGAEVKFYLPDNGRRPTTPSSPPPG